MSAFGHECALESDIRSSKKLRLASDENTRWTGSGSSEDDDDLFNLTGLHGPPASLPLGCDECDDHSLYSGEQLDPEEDSSSTNDMMVVSTVIASVAKSQSEGEVALFDPWSFIRSLPAAHSFIGQVQQVISEHGTLPPAPPVGGSPTLVLDLDETLVHSSVMPLPRADYQFPVSLDGNDFTVYCKKRPYCSEFLTACRAMGWEICVFTASKRVYADRVLDMLDPTGELLGGPSQRLFRDHCLMVGGNFVKHLSVLQRNLARTVIVDNSLSAFALHMENGIPIDSFFDDESDTELHKLLELLEVLVKVDDVRPVLAKQFSLLN